MTPPVTRIDTWTRALTRRSVNAPWLFIALALLVIAGCSLYASRLTVLGSPVHLLPTWDATAQRYNGALDRKGSNKSDLKLVIESPDPEQNRKLVTALEERLQHVPGVTRVDHGPEAERAYYAKYKWLFVPTRDLALVECELRKARESAAPGYVDLDDPCEEQVAEEYGKAPGGAAPASGDAPPAKGKPAADESPLRAFEREMKRRVAEVDRFPSGYYTNEDGTQYLLIVYTAGAGMGEFSSDAILADVKSAVSAVEPTRFHPAMRVTYGGKVPQGIAERDALMKDIAWVSGLGVGLILLSIAFFFRSPTVLVHIGLCVATGVSIAFATAMLAYGHLNLASSFLLAIVAGNGVNYGIMYLARYQERRALGDTLEVALVEAAVEIRKGTWLAALAAAGAFGCLLLTSFRGFSEFGLIGGVGLLACWTATFLILPASVTAGERIVGAVRRRTSSPLRPRAPRQYGSELAAAASERAPLIVLALGVALTVAAVVPLPGYLSDPWEYNFSKLTSRSSQTEGAGRASSAADKITKVRGSPVLFLADDQTQALDLARQVEEADQRLGGNRFIERTETIYDYLGGTPEEVAAKLAVLGEIRAHIDAVKKHLKGEDARVALEWRPPNDLRAPTPKDLTPMLSALFTERDGRVGTPVYAYLSRGISQSDGANMLAITAILESVKLPDGRIAPNASSTTVFTAIIRSLERDAPRAILAALLLVLVVTLTVTRKLVPAAAVIGSLVAGVLLTVGGAAWLGVRLNFLNFVAIPLTFGIGVEYAINLHERVSVHGGNVGAGVRSAGGPVFLCSLTTIFGYAALLVSDNRALQSFGNYAVAGELACISTALFLMPAALQLLVRRPTAEPAPARGSRDAQRNVPDE